MTLEILENKAALQTTKVDVLVTLWLTLTYALSLLDINRFSRCPRP